MSAESLVQRLEEHAGSAVHHWEDWANRSDTLLREAAAEIERLKASARQAIDGGEIMIATLTAERDAAERDKAALVAALKLCRSALAALIDPNLAVSGVGIQSAYTQCVEAEAKARAALANMEGKNDG